MKNRWLLALLLLTLVFGSIMTPIGSVQAKAGKEKDSICISPQMVKLKTDMQKVWIDHTI